MLMYSWVSSFLYVSLGFLWSRIVSGMKRLIHLVGTQFLFKSTLTSVRKHKVREGWIWGYDMKDKEGQVKVSQKIFFFLLTYLSFKMENQLAKSLAEASRVCFSAVSYCTGHNIESLRLTSVSSGMFPYWHCQWPYPKAALKIPTWHTTGASFLIPLCVRLSNDERGN